MATWVMSQSLPSSSVSQSHSPHPAQTSMPASRQRSSRDENGVRLSLLVLIVLSLLSARGGALDEVEERGNARPVERHVEGRREVCPAAPVGSERLLVLARRVGLFGILG